MNATGRLPGFCLLHVGLRVRLTQTTESSIAVTDASEVVIGIEPDEREPKQHFDPERLTQRPVVVLRYMPQAVYVRLDETDDNEAHVVDLIKPKACAEHVLQSPMRHCSKCIFYDNVVAVTPFKNTRASSLEIPIQDTIAKVKVKRTQIPLVTEKGSTLHVLHGNTCDPGLVFHWRFPRRLALGKKLLAVYVALSRVRALSKLRSIGMTTKIRKIIEAGPQRNKQRRAAFLSLGWNTD